MKLRWLGRSAHELAVEFMDQHYQDCTLLHVDADGFFAAVEQSLNPALRGRPVVTGAERGIIAAASYEAKARGISRGLQLHEARRLCPDLVVVPCCSSREKGWNSRSRSTASMAGPLSRTASRKVVLPPATLVAASSAI